MFVHLMKWFVNNEGKKMRDERQRGLSLALAARTAAGGLDEPTAAAVVAECRAWVCNNGVASPKAARFFDELARWTGTSFAAFGAVEVTTDRGEQVRHWYVAEVDSNFKVLFADMVNFDPGRVGIADLQLAVQGK